MRLVLVILINLIGWGIFAAFSYYLKLNIPDWINALGFPTVVGIVVGIIGTVIASTYAIEFAMERRQRERS